MLFVYFSKIISNIGLFVCLLAGGFLGVIPGQYFSQLSCCGPFFRLAVEVTVGRFSGIHADIEMKKKKTTTVLMFHVAVGGK